MEDGSIPCRVVGEVRKKSGTVQKLETTGYAVKKYIMLQAMPEYLPARPQLIPRNGRKKGTSAKARKIVDQIYRRN
ncbi:MAG: hypothetical protein Kapaf2KO_22680 [Candidatus Kapaibacteriales bacterium]